jgi:hypothetical protein
VSGARRLAAVLALAACVLCVSAGPVLAGEPPTSTSSSSSTSTTTSTPTTTSTTLPSNEPAIDLDDDNTILFVALLVGGLAVLLFLPLLANLLASYRLQRNQQRFLEHLSKEGQLKGRELTTVVQSYERVTPPCGGSSSSESSSPTQSMTTSLLALAILVLVALALVVMLLAGSSDAGDLRKTIITALLSILATIGGFYFGARTAQVSAAQAQSSSGSTDTPPSFVASTPSTDAHLGQAYAYDFRATGSPSPAYALDGAPDWLTIDTATGSMTGIVPSDATPFTYNVIATNTNGSATAGPFTVRIV